MTARVYRSAQHIFSHMGRPSPGPDEVADSKRVLARPAHLPALHASHSVARSHTLDVP
jgi:hypothetical protein